MSVTERNAFCWNLQEDEPKKVYQVKGLPDCSAVMNTNSIFMQSFEDPHAGYQDATGSGSQKNINLLFCLAGHKISAGEVTSKGLKDKRSGGGKEVSCVKNENENVFVVLLWVPPFGVLTLFNINALLGYICSLSTPMSASRSPTSTTRIT